MEIQWNNRDGETRGYSKRNERYDEPIKPLIFFCVFSASCRLLCAAEKKSQLVVLVEKLCEGSQVDLSLLRRFVKENLPWNSCGQLPSTSSMAFRSTLCANSFAFYVKRRKALFHARKVSPSLSIKLLSSGFYFANWLIREFSFVFGARAT